MTVQVPRRGNIVMLTTSVCYIDVELCKKNLHRMILLGAACHQLVSASVTLASHFTQFEIKETILRLSV